MAHTDMVYSQRKIAEELLQKKVSVAVVAVRAGVSHATLYKEIKSAIGEENYNKKRYELYNSAKAQEEAEARMLRRLRR